MKTADLRHFHLEGHRLYRLLIFITYSFVLPKVRGTEENLKQGTLNLKFQSHHVQTRAKP